MTSIFANRITDTIRIDDSEHTVTIRKLNPSAVSAAQKAAMRQSLADVKELGGPAFLQELRQLSAEPSAATSDRRDPLLTHDALTLIERGVVSWTYDEAVGRDAFLELDEEPRDRLANAILKLAKPSLYQSADEAEQAQKNG